MYIYYGTIPLLILANNGNDNIEGMKFYDEIFF